MNDKESQVGRPPKIIKGIDDTPENVAKILMNNNYEENGKSKYLEKDDE